MHPPTPCLWHCCPPFTQPLISWQKKEKNPGLLLVINVQIPFQVKLTLVVNLPAYMNTTKAPWIILSDILISATVSTRYLPPSCGSGVWRFSRVAILGVCVSLWVCVYVRWAAVFACVCLGKSWGQFKYWMCVCECVPGCAWVYVNVCLCVCVCVCVCVWGQEERSTAIGWCRASCPWKGFRRWEPRPAEGRYERAAHSNSSGLLLL